MAVKRKVGKHSNAIDCACDGSLHEVYLTRLGQVIWVCQVVLTATQMRVKCLVDQSRQGAHEVRFSVRSSDLVARALSACDEVP